jgi:precorrin-2 dehydrogenase/sirohydrochlorin ferrochelatase
MSYLVNLALEGRRAVVIGGGEVAARKVEDLLVAKAVVAVIAPQPCGRILKLAEEKQLEGRWRAYEAADLDRAFVAIAATDDEGVNARVAADAAARSILVNVVDRPALCTFTVPATVRRGDLTLAVATDGRCPALASILREELEERYGPQYAALLDLAAALRTRMVEARWTGPRVREALSAIYHSGVMDLLANPDREPLKRLLTARLGPIAEAALF